MGRSDISLLENNAGKVSNGTVHLNPHLVVHIMPARSWEIIFLEWIFLDMRVMSK